MNIYLIIALFIILFNALNGWRKGVLGIIYGLVSWIFIFIFVIMAQPHIQTFLIENTTIEETVHEKCSELVQNQEKAIISELQGNIPQQNIFDPSILLEGKNQGEKIIVNTMEQQVLKGISTIVTFVIGLIITAVVGHLLAMVGDLPGLRGINVLFGIIAGGLQGLIFIWGIMYVIDFLQATEFARGIMNGIRESSFLTYLYEHNLVVAILENFMG